MTLQTGYLCPRRSLRTTNFEAVSMLLYWRSLWPLLLFLHAVSSVQGQVGQVYNATRVFSPADTSYRKSAATPAVGPRPSKYIEMPRSCTIPILKGLWKLDIKFCSTFFQILPVIKCGSERFLIRSNPWQRDHYFIASSMGSFQALLQLHTISCLSCNHDKSIH